MYVYLFIYTFLYIYIETFIHTFKHLCMLILNLQIVHTHKHTHTHTHAYTHTQTHTYIISVCALTRIHMCMRIIYCIYELIFRKIIRMYCYIHTTLTYTYFSYKYIGLLFLKTHMHTKMYKPIYKLKKNMHIHYCT